MLKLLEKTVSAVLYLVSVVISIFLLCANTDVGKQGVCTTVSYISSIFLNANVVVSGWDGGLCLKELRVKTQKYSFSASDICLSNLNDGIISVDNATITGIFVNNKIRITSVDFAHDVVVPISVDFFSSLKVSKLTIDDIVIKQFRCDVSDGVFNIHARLKDGQIVCTYNSSSSQYDISITDCFGVTGIIKAVHCADENLKFQSSLMYMSYLLEISGEYIKAKDEINFNANISGESICGELCVSCSVRNKKCNYKGKFNNIPEFVRSILRKNNLSVNLSGDCDFNRNGNVEAIIYSADIPVSKCLMSCNKGSCKIICATEKLDWFSLNVDRVESSFDLKNISDQRFTIFGGNWSIYANVLFDNSCITVRDCSIKHANCSSKIFEPFVINDNVVQSGRMQVEINDIRCISDFTSLIKRDDLSGACVVTLGAHNNGIHVKVDTDKLSYKFVDLYGFEIICGKNNCDLDMVGCEIFGRMVSDLHVSKNGRVVSCACSLGNAGYLKADAVLENKKLNIQAFELLFDELKIESKNATIDFSNLDFISLFDVTLDGGTSTFYVEKKLDVLHMKADITNIPLRILQKIDNRIDSSLVHGLFFNSNVDICIRNDDIVGNLVIDVNDSSRSDVLFAKLKLDKDFIILNGKYSRFGDFIDCRIVLPQNIKSKDDVKIAGDIAMSVKLKNLFFIPMDRVMLNGDCNAELTVSGTSTAPIVDGTVKIDHGSVESSSVSIKNITINTLIRNNKINIVKANAIHRKGMLNITGGGIFDVKDGWPRILCDMNVRFADFSLINSDSLKCVFDGTINAKGPIEHLTLSGNIDMIDGVYETKYESNTNYNDINVIRIGKKPKTIARKDSSINPPFHFDVLANCKNLRIIGDSISAVFNGDLNVISVNDTLSLDGSVQLNDGYIKMVGSRIKLRSGHIAFRKENGLNPQIKLSGNSIVRDMQVFVDINNESGKLNLDIRSNPSYSIEDILSKIIFNRQFQELSLAESTKLSNAVKNMHHTRSSLAALDFIRDLVFVDSFSFSDSSAGVDDGNTVNAGKYIGDKIYLGVEKATEKEAKYKVKLNLSPQVAVEANTRGEAGISWMYRY